jgi:hypothetical protein
MAEVIFVVVVAVLVFGVVVVGVVVVVVIDGITAYVAGSSNTHVRAYRPFCLTVLPTKAGFLHGVCV